MQFYSFCVNCLNNTFGTIQMGQSPSLNTVFYRIVIVTTLSFLLLSLSVYSNKDVPENLFKVSCRDDVSGS